MISLVAASVGVLVGMGIALQTGINSVLRKMSCRRCCRLLSLLALVLSY